MGSPAVRLSREDSFALLTLARPERRNALSLEMMRAVTALLREVGSDVSVAAVILAAEGPVFSSGHDLSELRGRSSADYAEIFEACTDLMETVQRIPQPVIAEVQGLATAAGCQLVATCDLAIAGESAAFATPGVKIGLFCTTPMVALTRAVGRKRALEMLLTGRLVKPREAADWGLVNRVVPDAELHASTLELARAIAAASTFTVALGKQAFYTQIDLSQGTAYSFAEEVMSANAAAGDAQEGISAFLEKRPARWTGRV